MCGVRNDQDRMNVQQMSPPMRERRIIFSAPMMRAILDSNQLVADRASAAMEAA